MMLRLQTVVAGLVIALPLLVTMVLSEPFYQRRDHKDQEKYQHTTNINVVKDLTDAEFVLSKYGYLLCHNSRRKRETGPRVHSRRLHRRPLGDREAEPQTNLWSGLEEGVGSDGCRKDEIRKAILHYQTTYNLPKTGKLDKETMSLMSTSRCGNKDSADENIPHAKMREETLVPPVVSEGASQSESSVQDSSENGAVTTTAATDVKSSTEKTSHRLWRRSADPQNSPLLSVLSEKKRYVGRTHKDHRAYLEEFISREKEKHQRSGQDIESVNKRWRTLLLKRYTRSERRKRSVRVKRSPLHRGMLFSNKVVTWRLLTTGLSTRIPLVDQRASIELAFRMWSEVIPINFKEDNDGHINSVDIEIAFGKGSHQDCDHDFDGNGGEIAHSWNIGDMHFDDDESFRSLGSAGHDGIYLLRVAVHEIGHVLGLAHTNKSQSIMYAIYRGAQASQFELSHDDRQDIQQIYGVCKGSFDTVFDWVRRTHDLRYVYNTYFFRDNHYWMYENHSNRTRYGDPLYIAREWSGVPNNIDGYVHVWYFGSKKIYNEAYFFKGEHYYKYNSVNDTVEKGWPKLISEGFGPKPGGTVGVPSNIDSVFFDKRDLYIYFFKGDDVYVYDPQGDGCCVAIAKLQDAFPAAEGHRPLPAHLDSVYYSYQHKMQYFIKGDDYWRNKLFDTRQEYSHNSVEYMGKWYDNWFDICDVHGMARH
ncbi:hypothetical protein EGW08_001267 [Elysia chlorotica]|uniref:Peptidase metallopeptidase domain-containing protein n=1 Tax=Elysia chlorotica TaxID=188477 RepID=A0A3S1BX36_ELYCH|nr:hypothetical protein EGW08_001267 [Elysia chlorotica]